MWLESDKNFIRFDEKSNTYDSLEKLLVFLDNTEKDLNYWKWVIFALHNALYGAMILSLQGTNSARVTKNKKLISFFESFDRIQKEKYMRMYVGSTTFQAKNQHNESIKWLNNELRNPFAHFSPRGWSINIQDVKNILKSCLEIVEFCLFNSGNVLPDEQEIKIFRNIMKRLQNHKNLLIDGE